MGKELSQREISNIRQDINMNHRKLSIRGRMALEAEKLGVVMHCIDTAYKASETLKSLGLECDSYDLHLNGYIRLWTVINGYTHTVNVSHHYAEYLCYNHTVTIKDRHGVTIHTIEPSELEKTLITLMA
jgi:hypothetical protein